MRTSGILIGAALGVLLVFAGYGLGVFFGLSVTRQHEIAREVLAAQDACKQLAAYGDTVLRFPTDWAGQQ